MTDPVPGPEEIDAARMPLLEHLRELRYRLVVSGGTVFLGMLLGLLVAEPVFAFLTAPVRALLEGAPEYAGVDALYARLTAYVPEMLRIERVKGTLAITSSPMEGVMTYLRVGLLTGVVLASPVLAWQFWRFVAPGLYRTERRAVLPLAVASTLLFALGAGFTYAAILPIALPFFLTVLPADAVLSIDGYLSTVVRMLLVFGLCFQLPVVVWFLARLGLVDHRDLIHGFRYAIVGIFVVSALVTPPDVITQTLLAGPLMLLYAVGVVVARVASTKERVSAGS